MKKYRRKLVICLALLFIGLSACISSAQENRESYSWQQVKSFFLSIPWKQGFNYTKELLKKTYTEVSAESSLISHDVIKNLFRVQVSEISGIQRLNQDRILTTLDEEQLHWFWYYAFNGINARLKKDPWIKEALVKWKIYPLRLTLDIEEQQPWIVAELNNESWLISEDGSVIESLKSLERNNIIVESSELPRLDGLEEKDNGNTSLAGRNVRLHHAVSLLLMIKRAGGIPFGVDRYSMLDEGGFRISPKDPDKYPELLIAPTDQGELNGALKRLQIVLSDLELRGEAAKQIDLRFSNRSVVEYKQAVPDTLSRKHK